MRKLRFAFYLTGIAAMLSMPAFAYVDPSVTTFAFQAIAAVIVAAGAVAGVMWRKAKKKAQQVLNIDENAGKTVEDDLVVFAEEAKEAAEQTVEAAAGEAAEAAGAVVEEAKEAVEAAAAEAAEAVAEETKAE